MMQFKYPENATPLEPEELEGLIPSHITTQDELNAWEEKNILEAQQWAFRQKEILSVAFVQELHQHMFDKTWKWAGKFRLTEKNLFFIHDLLRAKRGDDTLCTVETSSCSIVFRQYQIYIGILSSFFSAKTV